MPTAERRDEETPSERVPSKTSPDARLPPAHALARRAEDAPTSSTERPPAAHPRLKRTRGFNAVYRRGRWARGSWLSVGAARNIDQITRVGLRTRRGLKGAVVRNRLKRQIRAIVDARAFPLRAGLDIVIVIHPPSRSLEGGTQRGHGRQPVGLHPKTIPAKRIHLEEELRTLCRRIDALS